MQRLRNLARAARLSRDQQQEPRAALEKEVRERLVRPLTTGEYGDLLKRCGVARDLKAGRMVHAHIVRSGYEHNTYVANMLLRMYGDCGAVGDARRTFSSIRCKNAHSWKFFMAALAKNGDVDAARRCFDGMQERDVVVWTSMLTAYAQNGHPGEALELFRRMLHEGVTPDRITFIGALTACKGLKDAQLGSILAAEAALRGFATDLELATSLLSMYSRCGCTEASAAVFKGMPKRNVVTWTTLLEGYTRGREVHRSRLVFDRMPERSLFSWVMIISVYTHTGCMQQAKLLLQEMPERSVVAWSILVATSAHSGHLGESLYLFQLMDLEGITPDTVTLINLYDAYTKQGACKEATVVQAAIWDTELVLDAKVATAMVTFHGKCGRLGDAEQLFCVLAAQSLDVRLWTAMMSGYARNGLRERALHLFKEMNLMGVNPSNLTFTVVLFACSHSGLLADGCNYFLSLQRDYGLTPDFDLYVSMVDLLGRAGRVSLARDLIEEMPYLPNQVVWTTLLGASKVYSDTRIGEQAGKQLLEVSQESASYALLSGLRSDC